MTNNHVRSLPFYFIVIPQQVIRELDGLKKSDVGKAAREASRKILNYISENNKCLILQKVDEVFSDDGRNKDPYKLTKDDAILNCALYFKDIMKKKVFIITGDMNFNILCKSHNIQTYNEVEFKGYIKKNLSNI